MARTSGGVGQRPSRVTAAPRHDGGDPGRSPCQRGLGGPGPVVPPAQSDPLPRLRDARTVACDLAEHAGAVRRAHRPDVRQDDEDPDLTGEHAADCFLGARSRYGGQGTASMTAMYVRPADRAPRINAPRSGPGLLVLRGVRSRLVLSWVVGLRGAF